MKETETFDGQASWRNLLTREYLPKLATMALALWLHASNSMLTATTMPSAVEEIGGLNLISWTFALYLAGSIVAAASISYQIVKDHGGKISATSTCGSGTTVRIRIPKETGLATNS